MVVNSMQNVAPPVGHLTIEEMSTSLKKLKDYVLIHSSSICLRHSTIPQGVLLLMRIPSFEVWSDENEIRKVVAEDYSELLMEGRLFFLIVIFRRHKMVLKV